MSLDRATILKLAKLAKLELNDKEIASYQKQLLEILAFVDKIKKLKLAKVQESLSGVSTDTAGPRPDTAESSWPATIESAAEIQDGYMAAPGVFEK